MPSPVDGSIWGSCRGIPGAVVRLAPGSNPPETALAEIYNVPLPGFGVRGARHRQQGRRVGVARPAATSAASIAASARGRSTARRRPAITARRAGRSTSIPGPGFEGIGDNSAESSYYTWVDQHNTFGLGDDVPMSTGNLNDGLIALKDGKMVVLRVPYPLGFYAKGFDGRIDDPNAGWKGRGLWAANGDRTPWLIEGGKGTQAAGRALPAAAGSAGEVAPPSRNACYRRSVSRPAAIARRGAPRPTPRTRSSRAAT